MPIPIDSEVMEDSEYEAKRKRINDLKIKFMKAKSIVKVGMEGTTFLGGYNPGDRLSVDQTLVKLSALHKSLIECVKD